MLRTPPFNHLPLHIRCFEPKVYEQMKLLLAKDEHVKAATKTTSIPAITVGLSPRPAGLTLSFDPERKYRPDGINEDLRASLLGSMSLDGEGSDASMGNLSAVRCDSCKKNISMTVSLNVDMSVLSEIRLMGC